MIFKSKEEVIQLLKKNITPPTNIIKARSEHKTLKALILGKDFKSLLLKIEGIEKDEKRAKARQKYSRSLKDLNERIMRPLDNIYSAAGGTKEYQFEGEDHKNLINKLSRVRDNKSLESWLCTNWCYDFYHVDPNGVIFMEYIVSKEKNDVWPVYASIDSIRNYKPRGQNIEWIIFEPEKLNESQVLEKYGIGLPQVNDKSTIDIWRVVDDKTDYRFIQRGEIFTLIEDKKFTFDHPFGIVPGVINSDIVDLRENIRLTPFDKIIEIEQEYLRDLSIKTIFKFKKGLPRDWRYRQVCVDCHGMKKSGGDVCPTCDGQGYMKDSDITDEVIIPLPESKEDPIITPNIAGRIEPSIETWDQYTKEIELLENYIHITQWGAESAPIDKKERTAYEKFIDTQPKITRLNKYADVAQWVEWQISEFIANFLIPLKKKDESKTVISYGRMYIVKPYDVLMKEYYEGRKEQAPMAILDRILQEIITLKYKNDPKSLRIELIKKEIEPYVHMSIKEVQEIYGQKEAQKKGLFRDWFEQLDYKELIKVIDNKALIDQFEKWFTEKTGMEGEGETPLALQLGVSGTQSLQAIITDTSIEAEQKRAMITILFGISEEDAKLMVPDKKEPEKEEGQTDDEKMNVELLDAGDDVEMQNSIRKKYAELKIKKDSQFSKS